MDAGAGVQRGGVYFGMVNLKSSVATSQGERWAGGRLTK